MKALAQTALAVLAISGCSGEGLTGPTSRPIQSTPSAPTSVPFRLQLTVDQIGGEQCKIRVTAIAEGGHDGSYAEWGDLKGRSYDGVTGEFIGVSRTQPLYPKVFSADRIRSSDTQWGDVNLEYFRRDQGTAVLVELEFYYTVSEDGASGSSEERMAKLSLECL